MQAETQKTRIKRRKAPTAAQLRRSIEVRDKLDALLNLVQTVSQETNAADDDPVLEDWECCFISDMRERLKGIPPLQLLAKDEASIVEMTDKLTRLLLKTFIAFVKGEDVLNSWEAGFVVSMERLFASRSKLSLSEKQLVILKKITASVKRGIVEPEEADEPSEEDFAETIREGYDEDNA